MFGAIIGDIVGSRFEFNNIRTKDFKLITNESDFTDDTVMTIAVWDMYLNGYLRDKDKIIETFKKWGRKYPSRGYGGNFARWLFTDDVKPYRSYGNGSGMRISPIGLIAKSEEEVYELSYNVTSVTHNHPEGIKGAYVTAMMIYKAKMGANKDELKEYAIKMYPKIKDLNYDDLVLNYRFNETSMDTIPEAIYCFLISTDFLDCLRTSISIGGDSDTLAAISMAIAEAYYKQIPDDLMAIIYDKLPADMLNILKNCEKKLKL